MTERKTKITNNVFLVVSGACISLWLIVSLFIPVDQSMILSLLANEDFFFAQRALVGSVVLFALALVLPLFQNISKVSVETITKALRISLSIYFGLYWYFYISYFWATKVRLVLELDFVQVIWPVLLLFSVIGVALFMLYEPWVPFFKSAISASRASFTLMRAILYSGIFFSFALFTISGYPFESFYSLVSTLIGVLLGLWALKTRRVERIR